MEMAVDSSTSSRVAVISGPPYPSNQAELDALVPDLPAVTPLFPGAELAVLAARVWPAIGYASPDDLLLLVRGDAVSEPGCHLFLQRGRLRWRLVPGGGFEPGHGEVWYGRVAGLFRSGALLHRDFRFWGRHWLSAESLVLVGICMVDMLSTLGLWSVGLITEANPSLAHWLEQGVGHFVFVKIFSFVPAVCLAEYLTPLRPGLFRPLLRWVIYFYLLVWGMGIVPVIMWWMAGAPPPG